jgi:hypothetical protein
LTTKKNENTVEEKLQSLLEEVEWSLTGKERKTKKGSKKNRQNTWEEVFVTKIGGSLDK